MFNVGGETQDYSIVVISNLGKKFVTLTYYNTLNQFQIE